MADVVANGWRVLKSGSYGAGPPLDETSVELRLADGHVLTARYRRLEIEAGRDDLITPIPQDGQWVTEFGHGLSWTNPPLYWRPREPPAGPDAPVP